jgi:hypothetical protein
MNVVTKEDIIHAFKTNQRKRNNLLYHFYKDKYFSQGFTAKFIAGKLTQELGVPITENMVFLIFNRIVKKDTAPASGKTPLTVPLTNNSAPAPQEVPTSSAESQQQNFLFKNADEYPKKNPFADLLKSI